MKISKIIDLLIAYKKEYGDIEVYKNNSFTGSDLIDSMIFYEDKLILFNSDKEYYMEWLREQENDI